MDEARNNKKLKRKPIRIIGNAMLRIFTFSFGFPFSKYIYLIIYFLLLLPLMVIAIAFVKPDNDTLPLTNIGFAVLAGLSAVAFSWARAIDSSDKATIDKIVYAGELALQSAIFFLLASAFKYAYTQFVPKNNLSVVGSSFRNIILWASFICFYIALFNFLISTLRLCLVLKDRVRNDPPID